MSEIKEEPSNVEWTKEMADSCQPSDIVRFGIRAAYNQGYHDAIEAYKTMLELEKEENIARWKQISPAKIYECFKCGQIVMTDDIDVYKYCHGCGRRMQSDE